MGPKRWESGAFWLSLWSMEFRKVIPIPLMEPKYSRSDRITLWGSCFASELADYLEQDLYPVTRSPFGILYNPLSIARGLARILEGEEPCGEELFCHEGAWHSFMHHGSFSSEKREEALARMQAAFRAGREGLLGSKLLVLTLGTAYVYTTKEGEVVNNCHKLPASAFERRRVSVDEVVAALGPVLTGLLTQCPDLRVLLTVSPIPHYADGAHESRLSKSTLLLAVDELTRSPRVNYFPSYEIMQDELRDYRFYREDYAHPSAEAVAYIMLRFRKAYLTRETIPEWEKLKKLLQHRPLTDSEAKRREHYRRLLERLESFAQKNPHPYLQSEITRLKNHIIA